MGIQCENVEKKRMTHEPGETEQGKSSFHDATQNRAHFKTYELFISIQYFWTRGKQAMENKTMNKGSLLYTAPSQISGYLWRGGKQ